MYANGPGKPTYTNSISCYLAKLAHRARIYYAPTALAPTGCVSLFSGGDDGGGATFVLTLPVI